VSVGYAIYFVDRLGHRVVRWDPDSGEARVIAGGPSASDPSQTLSEPYGLAFEPAGTLLISDKLNHRICRLRKGQLETVPMRDMDGHRAARPDSPAMFDPDKVHCPTSLAVEKGGAILCAFYDDDTIYRIHPNGRLELVLGLVPNRHYFHNPPRQSISMEDLHAHPIVGPTGMVLRSDGTIFFVERQSQVVREFHPNRGLRSLFSLSQMPRWFQRTEAPEEGTLEEYHPVYPSTLTLGPDESLYLCDNLHGCVLRIDVERARFRRVLHHRRTGPFLDGGPVAVAFGSDGTPWVANSDTQELRAYSLAGDGTWVPASPRLASIGKEPLRLGGGGMGVVAGS